MSRNNDLPFPRGETAYGGDTALIAAADASAYTGIEVQVTDVTTGQPITLVAMRNSSGGAIYPGYGYKPLAGYIGTRVDTFPAANGLGYVLDSYYLTTGVTSVANGDVAWFVKDGRVSSKTGANWANGNALVFAANGVMVPALASTTAGAYVIARANEAITHSAAPTLGSSGTYGTAYVGASHGFYAQEAVSQSGL